MMDVTSIEEDRNVIVVYLKNDLTYGDLVPLMREYIDNKYELDNSIDFSLKKRIIDAVGKVKNIFDEVYKSGMIMYSDIHGKLEVDILAYALKPFYIRTGHINSDDKAIVVITDKDIMRIEGMYNKKIIFDKDLIKEIEQHTKDYMVTEDGDVILKT